MGGGIELDKMLRIAGRDESGRARAVELAGGLLKTNVGDNCSQNDFAIDQVVAAGQALNVTNLIHFNGGKVSIGVRWKSGPVKFKVRLVGTSHTNSIVSDDIILSANSQRQNVVAELKQKKSAVYIENTGDTNETLDVVTITQFVSDSVAPNQGHNTQRHLGYSSDTKPISAGNGDVFLELDTGKVFIYYNEWRVFA